MNTNFTIFRNMVRVTILCVCTWFGYADAQPTGASAEEVEATKAMLRTTRDIQVVLIPNTPGYYYASNIGGSIINNFFAPTDPGATYVFGGLIFPAGTVNPSQSTYSVDKNNVPLTQAGSIGQWQCQGVRIAAVDFSNLPAPGTILEIPSMGFYFKNPVSDNVIFSSGFIRVSQPELSPVAFDGVCVIYGGLGSNKDAEGTHDWKVYAASDGTVLVNARFEKSITYARQS